MAKKKKKLSGGELVRAIAESAEISKKDAKLALTSLVDIACDELQRCGIFAIPKFFKMVVKDVPARKAGKREMFGKVVKVAARPASQKLKAYPLKGAKDRVL